MGEPYLLFDGMRYEISHNAILIRIGMMNVSQSQVMWVVMSATISECGYRYLATLDCTEFEFAIR